MIDVPRRAVLGAGMGTYRDRCFNLVYTVAGTSDLPEGIYTVGHLRVPTHALLLSSLGGPRTGPALVNRSV